MLPTMKKIKESTQEEGNFTIVVGDFNGERWHKRDYSARLTEAGLTRVETGKRENQARRRTSRRKQKTDQAEKRRELG